MEFRVYAVSSRLKAELRTMPSAFAHQIRMVGALRIGVLQGAWYAPFQSFTVAVQAGR